MDQIPIAAAILGACLLAWDIARRYLAGADREAVAQLRAEHEQLKADTEAQLKELKDKVIHVSNRTAQQRARHLTGLNR